MRWLAAARWLLIPAFLAASLALYAPSFDGAFVSDDEMAVSGNPWVRSGSPRALLELWKPWGEVPNLIKNYAPLHLTLHALEWRAFGEDVRGYHVVNALVHALAALLLVALFARCGVDPRAAAFGGALFLVHPANVEAVAWISQLKTTAALALAVGALLAHPNRPVLGLLLFVAALLCKPTAAVALPVAALGAWLRPAVPRPGAGAETAAPGWRWLVLWAVALAAFAAAQFAALGSDEPAPPVHEAWSVRLPSSAVIALRYLWMALTSLGLSTFHQPAPTLSPLDPRFAAAVAVLAACGWRALHVLRRRRPEAAFWAWALVSYAPVSQLAVPFRYPMADRYLYFILPGLIGAALLAAPGAWRALSSRSFRATWLHAAVLAVAVAWVGLFAARSHERAAIWKTPLRVSVDAALHYPDGTHAALLRARAAAAAGDVEATVAALGPWVERGAWNRFDVMQRDPAWRRVRDAPEFRALLRRMAAGWVAHLEGRPLSEPEARLLAEAHALLAEAPQR